MTSDDNVYVGFNRRVAALDKHTGQIVWEWKAPDGTGYVSLLLDGDRLFAAVNGYTYSLDPVTGQQLWINRMKGFGYGVTCLATRGGHTDHHQLGQAGAEAETAAAAGGSAGVAGS